MKIAARTISALGKIITGDSLEKTGKPVAPYQSGPKLVAFFNQFGGDAQYGQGFPSRWAFAEDKIREHNDSPILAQIICDALSPGRFLDTDFKPDNCVAYLNPYLKFDGYEIIAGNDAYSVRDLKGSIVCVENPFKEQDKVSHVFISEQLDKADAKITSGDFSGAITNARSLVEAVLIELEGRISGQAEPYDGDLVKLYKRVQKLLNLDPARKDISDSLRTVLSGLVSIVAGLAPMRNKMSDAHAATYRAAKRHAKLAVNVAKTLTDFLHETYQFQTKGPSVMAIGKNSKN